MRRFAGSLIALLFVSCASEPRYDVVIRGGTVYDGTGSAGRVADIALEGDRIVAIGDLDGEGRTEIAARGLAVAPGFINMLSWATETLLVDGSAESDIRQGVTLEVFGEGVSMGPLNEAMRQEMIESQGDLRFDVEWDTLGGYLEHLQQRGVAPNVASFLGATTARIYVLGYENRPPDDGELEQMQELVREAMLQGALGVGSSLIYAPAFYAATDELVALCQIAGEMGGSYISHMRSEGNRLIEAYEELEQIARRANIAAEIYHLKAAGRSNWDKLDEIIRRVEAARDEGLAITADMYTYRAGATGLDAAMPPWVQEGGYDAWAGRLRDPEIRRRVIAEMRTETDEWENLLLAAGTADNALLVGFKNPELKPLTGRTLAEVAAQRGVSPEEAAIDLVIEDGSRVGTVYFLMDEENVRRQIKLPWVSFGSDAGAPAPREPFTLSNPHPRAYGNFARLLGRYVRDEGLIPLEEAIRRLTGFPATNLKIKERGFLREGYFADIAIFDPARVRDLATFDDPHQLAEGMVHVFVNGEAVLSAGEMTEARPGRVVRGPAWEGWQ